MTPPGKEVPAGKYLGSAFIPVPPITLVSFALVFVGLSRYCLDEEFV